MSSAPIEKFVLALICWDFLDNESSDVDLNDFLLLCLKKRRKHAVRINNYFEKICQSYDDYEFRRNFRISMSTTQTISELLKRNPNVPTPEEHGRGRPPIDVHKQVLITIWYLANPSCVRDISDRFNVTTSSVFNVTRRITLAIKELAPDFIIWPSGDEAKRVIHAFHEMRGLSGVIGLIDGTHIPCKKPHDDPLSYINRKGFHSVIVQGICDNNLIFTNVNVGFPGSVHDGRVFLEQLKILTKNLFTFQMDVIFWVMQHMLALIG